LEDLSGDAFALAQEAEEEVFGAYIGVLEAFGFLAGQSQDFFHPRGVGDVVRGGGGVLADFHVPFDFLDEGFGGEAHFFEYIDGDALAEFDEAEEEVFGAYIVVVATLGFIAGHCQNLLGARSEVIHGKRLVRNLSGGRFGEAGVVWGGDRG